MELKLQKFVPTKNRESHMVYCYCFGQPFEWQPLSCTQLVCPVDSLGQTLLCVVGPSLFANISRQVREILNPCEMTRLSHPEFNPMMCHHLNKCDLTQDLFFSQHQYFDCANTRLAPCSNCASHSIHVRMAATIRWSSE